MRLAAVLILLASAGGVAYLFLEGDEPGRRQENRERATETGRDPVGDEPRTPGALPEPEPETLAAFVAACRERGADAVPLLLRRLRLDPDRRFEPRWKFENGELVGFPTLRAAYLSALAAIPGDAASDALEQLLPGVKSVEESYLIALALADRGRVGWSEEVLRRAGVGTAANQGLRVEMAEFAARKDPAGTAAIVLDSAPRDDSTGDGRILAAAVGALPYDMSVATTERVLEDERITPRAKSAIVRGVLRRRPEPAVFGTLEEQMRLGRLDGKLRIDAAYAAANSIWFVNDLNEYETAVAAADSAKADEIRRRFEERLRAARSLVRTAVGADDDARAKAMLRILEAYEKRMR